MRQNIARLTKTSPEILHLLSKDPSAKVRCLVANNPNTSIEILNKILEKKNENTNVFMNIAKNYNATPDLLHNLSLLNNRQINFYIAQHRNTSYETLANLEKDESLKQLVIENPNYINENI